MKTIALYEAKNRLSELIDAVQAGEVVAITRRGQLHAHLTAPPIAVTQHDAVPQAFAQLARLRSKLDLDGDIKAIARAGLS